MNVTKPMSNETFLGGINYFTDLIYGTPYIIYWGREYQLIDDGNGATIATSQWREILVEACRRLGYY